jgi:hypothetical protein
MGVINDFLNHPRTRFHRHSLASYLLDELLKIEDALRRVLEYKFYGVWK